MPRNQIPPVPLGLVTTRSWLLERGVQRHTLDNWVKSGQVVAVERGVFTHPGTQLTWQGIACSLQNMGIDLRPGGLTALNMQGMWHYVSGKEQNVVHLYGQDPIPTWTNALLDETSFMRHKNLRSPLQTDWTSLMVSWNVQAIPFGKQEQSMQIASSELAMFQVLMDVPHQNSVEHADQLLQGLPNLSPRRLNALLENCQSIKVKRLFLWLAERNNSPWLKSIDLKRFSIESGALGSGKRMIVKGGRLDPKYLITVPKDMNEVPFG